MGVSPGSGITPLDASVACGFPRGFEKRERNLDHWRYLGAESVGKLGVEGIVATGCAGFWR